MLFIKIIFCEIIYKIYLRANIASEFATVLQNKIEVTILVSLVFITYIFKLLWVLENI